MGRWVRWFGSEVETQEMVAGEGPSPPTNGTRVVTISAEHARVVADVGEMGVAPAPTGQISVETLPAEMLTAILVEEGVLTRETEYACLQEHRTTGRPAEDIICDSGYVTESELMSILSRRCKVPHLSVEHYQVRAQVLEVVPAEFARANRVMPLDQLGKALNVATSNPLNVNVFRRLEEKTGLKVKPVLATPRELQACIDRYFPAPRPDEEEAEPTEESFHITAKDLFKESWLGRIDKEEEPQRPKAEGEPAVGATEEAPSASDESRAVPLSEDEASAFVKMPNSVLFDAWAASVGASEGDRGVGRLRAVALGEAEFAILAGHKPLPARASRDREEAAQPKKRRSVRKKARKKRKKKSGR